MFENFNLSVQTKNVQKKIISIWKCQFVLFLKNMQTTMQDLHLCWKSVTSLKDISVTLKPSRSANISFFIYSIFHTPCPKNTLISIIIYSLYFGKIFNTSQEFFQYTQRTSQSYFLSLIHIWRCRRSTLCRSRWSPYH